MRKDSREGRDKLSPRKKAETQRLFSQIDVVDTKCDIRNPLTLDGIATALTNAYNGDPLFTHVGEALFAVGPQYPQAVYDAGTAATYAEPGNKLAPHVFSAALKCHQCLIADSAPQSIAISGAETTNKAEIAKASVRFLAGLTDGILSMKVGAAMLIVEAFGNVTSTNGAGLSRMYSVYSLFCSETGDVKGMRIEPKLLDTTIVSSDTEDPNIFTFLVHGCPATDRSMYRLKEASSYRYISSVKRNGGHSAISFDFIKKAFLEMNIQVDEQEHIMCVVSAVLHLGNLEYEEDGSLAVRRPLDVAAMLLGVQPKALEVLLGEHKSREEAELRRDEVAKAIYGVLVCIIAARLNDELGREYALGDLFVAVVDAPGFVAASSPLGKSGMLANVVNELELELLHNFLVDKEKAFIAQGVPWESLDLEPRQLASSLRAVACAPTAEAMDTAAAEASVKHPCAITWNSEERFLRVKHQCGTVVYDLSNTASTSIANETCTAVAALLQGSKKSFLNSRASAVSEVCENVLARHTNQVSALLQPIRFTRSHHIHTLSAVSDPDEPPGKAEKQHIKGQLAWAFAEESLRFADSYAYNITCSQFMKFYAPIATSLSLQEENTGPHALTPHCKTILLSLGFTDASEYFFTDDKIWMKTKLYYALEDLRLALQCSVQKSKGGKSKSKKRRSANKSAFADLDLPKKRSAFPISLSPRTWTHGGPEQKLEKMASSAGTSVPSLGIPEVTAPEIDDKAADEKDKGRLAAFMHDISPRSLTHSEGLQALLSLSPRGKAKKGAKEEKEAAKRKKSRSPRLSPRSAFAASENTATHSSPSLKTKKRERSSSKLSTKAARSNSTGTSSRFPFSRGKTASKAAVTQSTPSVSMADVLSQSSDEEMPPMPLSASVGDERRPTSARKSVSTNVKRISLKSLVKSRSTSQKRLVSSTSVKRRHTDEEQEEKRVLATRASLQRIHAFSSEADRLDLEAARAEGATTTDDESDDSLLLSDDSCMDVSELSDGEEEVVLRPDPAQRRYGRDKLIKRRASQAIVSKDFIEKVENFAWRQSQSMLEGVPAAAAAPACPPPAQKRQDLQEKRRDEFLILYECGSLLRTVYRKDDAEQAAAPATTIKRGRSRSILLLLNNSVGDDAADVAEDEAEEEGKPRFTLEAKIKRDLEAFKLNPADPVEVAVSCLNYNNPIQLTPRRKNAASTNMFAIPGTQKFEDYALAYFSLPKKLARLKPGSSKYNAKLKKFLSHRKKPLVEPLHNFRSEALVTAALEAFSHILAYTEAPKAEAPAEKLPESAYAHAAALLQLGLERASLRDEIYCQLIKQTRGAKETTSGKVWDLLSFCSGNFAPSSAFINYYKSFLDDVMEDSGAVGAVASNCKDRLEKVVNYGKRLLVPTLAELRLVQARKPMMQTFFFMDGRQKQVPIYSSTTAEEALDFLLVMVGLRDPKGYMIYEHYKVTRPSGKVELTEKSLLYSEVLCNSLSKFQVFEQAFQRYQQVDRPGEEGLRMECYFLVKRKLFLDPRTLSTDKVENMLLFHQTHRNIISDELLLKESDALILGGLLLQILHGDYVKGFSYSPSTVLPSRLRKQKTKKEWKKLLNTRHRALRGVSTDEAKEMFLQYCKQLPFFGFNLFTVTHSSTWRMPQTVLLGINLAGLFFLSEDKLVYYSFSFLEVLTYSSSPRECFLSFDNGTNITLSTDKGDEILSLIIDYKYFELKKELDEAT